MTIGKIQVNTFDVITFVGMAITLFTSILNLIQNKKGLYINNITRYRVTWINTLRVQISTLKELSNITNLYVITREGVDKVAYRRELEKVVSLIKMHLNFCGQLDKKLILKVEELKCIINSYLLMHYFRNTIKSINSNDEIENKFNEAIDVISEKKVLDELLNIARNTKNIKNTISIKNLSLLDLRYKIKAEYNNNTELIICAVKESEYVIQRWEYKIEKINKEIDEIVQIYLKAEWSRCKKETRLWPFSRYNEEKTIKRLEKEYKVQAKK
ncbi:hypothetical protein [Clostridium saccharobutylicum]|uniref:Uncharacterized protein n=1 Tax=Clostridium saccharobutylicum TaxID=169679 RepID=A0A1S8N5D7_CLOSA|nr:hypothetical protein [Clostridium saccharobutylicum]OOM11736.1 hypothetical protein CLOSAC_21630 [Clostridium saccharobutylicum]